MGAKQSSFKKKVLAASISSCILASVSGGVAAQTATTNTDGQPKIVEEVLVRGIRSSIETSINIKRDSSTVVDAIVAEDIGKLPDVTISDSLQRISGVQIRRQAGEGSQVNIRGLPQVVSQLNGEQFLSAGSITSPEPDFGDIPSQLFSGAEVYKASVADLVISGISGTINLKTHRPFNFDEGVTTAFSAEGQYGEETQEFDPVLSGLFNWKSDRVGVLFAASAANVNLANYYNGVATHNPEGDLSLTRYNAAPSISWTGPADPETNWISPQGMSAWNQVTERERVGLNASVQVDVGAGFELVVDAFYTEQTEYNRKVGLNMTNKWAEFNNWVQPTTGTRTGTVVNSREWMTYSKADLNARRILSYAQNDSYDNESTNINVELNYDNGGAFTGGLRFVTAEASSYLRKGYIQGDLTNGQATLGRTQNFFPAEVCANYDPSEVSVIGEDGGCLIDINPNGYANRPVLNMDTSGSHMVLGGFDQVLDTRGDQEYTLGDYMVNQSSYVVGAYSAEGNEDKESTMDVARADGSYEFSDGFVTSVDFGARFAQREVSMSRFHYFSPFYDAGCEVQWKATDVALDSGTINPDTGEACTSIEQTDAFAYLDIDSIGAGISPDTDPFAYEAARNTRERLRMAEGNSVFGEYVPFDRNGDGVIARGEGFTERTGHTALPRTPLSAHGVNPIFVTDFGPVGGIPGVWAADPAAMDDIEGFHERAFGSIIRQEVPGRSFNVETEETTLYGQVNFAMDALSGNLGVRVVRTDMTILQNLAGQARPYGDTNFDAGDNITERSYTDVLPSLNLSYDVGDNMKVRFAASRNMTQLDMQELADGLTVSTSFDADLQGFVINSAEFQGNPELDPWRSNNYDLTYEWYHGGASMLSAGLFRIDVESFPVGGGTVAVDLVQPATGETETFQAPRTQQGDGGQIQGFEIGLKQSFADLDLGMLEDFGVEFNYTKSQSEQPRRDIYGRKLPFIDNSENQMNIIGYYENEKFQARIAYNYRDDRLAEMGNIPDHGGLALFQKPTTYVDISASYDINDNFTVYMNGSNVTGEYEDYYIQWEEQYAFQNYYEPRYTLGVRARF